MFKKRASEVLWWANSGIFGHEKRARRDGHGPEADFLNFDCNVRAFTSCLRSGFVDFRFEQNLDDLVWLWGLLSWTSVKLITIQPNLTRFQKRLRSKRRGNVPTLRSSDIELGGLSLYCCWPLKGRAGSIRIPILKPKLGDVTILFMPESCHNNLQLELDCV